MRYLTCVMMSVSLISMLGPRAVADGKSKDRAPKKGTSSAAGRAEVLTIDLLQAGREGLISVQAQGRSDGRMTVSLANRSRRALRVVLPPGIIAEGITGQFGGMGGMGGMGGCVRGG
jgi:hypothetical protein